MKNVTSNFTPLELRHLSFVTNCLCCPGLSQVPLTVNVDLFWQVQALCLPQNKPTDNDLLLILLKHWFLLLFQCSAPLDVPLNCVLVSSKVGADLHWWWNKQLVWLCGVSESQRGFTLARAAAAAATKADYTLHISVESGKNWSLLMVWLWFILCYYYITPDTYARLFCWLSIHHWIML